MNYEEHLAWLVRQELGARAERQGFVEANNPMSLGQGCGSAYERMRYRQGYEDGVAMLHCQTAQP